MPVRYDWMARFNIYTICYDKSIDDTYCEYPLYYSINKKIQKLKNKIIPNFSISLTNNKLDVFILKCT